jgi:hypothetical protein
MAFRGVGISGGEQGTRHGPSIMAGGPENAWQRVAPVFTEIAARYRGEACSAPVGPGGAGHFVKTIHNGIESAELQMIAEEDRYAPLRPGFPATLVSSVCSTMLIATGSLAGNVPLSASSSNASRWSRSGFLRGKPVCLSLFAMSAFRSVPSLRQTGLAHALAHMLGVGRVLVAEPFCRKVEIRLQPEDFGRLGASLIDAPQLRMARR